LISVEIKSGTHLRNKKNPMARTCQTDSFDFAYWRLFWLKVTQPSDHFKGADTTRHATHQSACTNC